MIKELDYILNDNKFIVSTLQIKVNNLLNLSLNEFLLITYFNNYKDNNLDANDIANKLGINVNIVLETLSNLVEKEIITIDSVKNYEGKINEVVCLDNYNKFIHDIINNDLQEKKEKDIFSIFEKELNKKITPIEYDIINSWLDKKYPEELIVGALKEAVFNGVNSLRYIDKILYEWNKQGLKTMKDVNGRIKEKSNDKLPELFDYDWLNEE